MPGTAPDSMSRRIGVPWLARLPSMIVGGVGVRVEVDDADVAVAVHVGDRGGGRPGDRVVPAEDDRHDAARRDGVDPLADVGVRHLGLAVRAVRVAEVDDLQPVEDLQPEIQVIGARLVGRGADRPRTEPGARPVGRGDVERRPDDGDVGPPGLELFDLGQERPMPERHDARVGKSSCSAMPGGRSRSGPWSC